MGRIVDISDVLLQAGLSSGETEEERAIATVAINQAERVVSKHIRYDPVQASRTEYYPRIDVNKNRTGIWEANENNAYLRRYSDAVGNELQLQHIPIRSSISIYIDYDGRFGSLDGSFASDTEKTLGQDFWPIYSCLDDDGNQVCMDGIVKSIGLWPTEPGSVKVVYTAGYSNDEFRGISSTIDATPIFQAVVGEAVRRIKSFFVNKKDGSVGWVAGPMTSESLGDYSYSIDSSLATKLYGSMVGVTTETKELLSDYVHWGFSQ